MRHLFVLLPLIVLGPSFADSIVQTDYRSACEAKTVGGAVYFDGAFCRCTVAPVAIDPFALGSDESCKMLHKEKRACVEAGEAVTRYMINAESSRPSGKCLCVPTGMFMREFEGSGDWTAPLEACKKTRAAASSRSSAEVGLMLSHYLSGLPRDVTPVVNLKSLESIFAFLDPSNAARTVKVVGTQLGVHGGIVHVYRKRFGSEGWLDTSDPVGQQGDPRGSYYGLGPIIGPYFGFQKLDENTYTMPSLDEFNRALTKVNEDGVLVVGSGYLVVGQFGSKEYLTRFEHDGSLPVSEFLPSGDQTYLFHDMTLHLASMVISPVEIYKAVQRAIAQRRSIGEQSIDAIHAPRAIKNEAKKKLYEGLVETVDGVSVRSLFAVYSFSSEPKPRSNPYASNFSYSFEQLFGKISSEEFAVSSFHPLFQEDVLRQATKLLLKQPENIEFEAMKARLTNAGIDTQRVSKMAEFLMNEHREKLERRIQQLQGSTSLDSVTKAYMP